MFVTPDSIVPNMFDPQSLNRYTYCRNNPLKYNDPSGHSYGDAWAGGPADCPNGKGTPNDGSGKPSNAESWSDNFNGTYNGGNKRTPSELQQIERLLAQVRQLNNEIDAILNPPTGGPSKQLPINTSVSIGIVSISVDPEDPTKTNYGIGWVGLGASVDIKIIEGDGKPIGGVPASTSFGLGDNLGVTVDTDGTTTVNLGFNIGGTPVTVTGNISAKNGYNPSGVPLPEGDYNYGFQPGQVWP